MLELLDYRVNRRQLTTPGTPVTPEMLNSEELKLKLAEMKEILKQDGVGLAALQVNWPVQLFMLCINQAEEKIEPQVFINPEILTYSKKMDKQTEGCLSFPNLFVNIERPSYVKWAYTDLEGQRHIIESTGFYARAVQHETDHCLGHVFIERVSSAQMLKVNKWLNS